MLTSSRRWPTYPPEWADPTDYRARARSQWATVRTRAVVREGGVTSPHTPSPQAAQHWTRCSLVLSFEPPRWKESGRARLGDLQWARRPHSGCPKEPAASTPFQSSGTRRRGSKRLRRSPCLSRWQLTKDATHARTWSPINGKGRREAVRADHQLTNQK